MNIGVASEVRTEGAPRRLEIAFRGKHQLLPGGAMVFLDQEQLKQAALTVAEKMEISIPLDFDFAQSWALVKDCIGHDYDLNWPKKVTAIDGCEIHICYKA